MGREISVYDLQPGMVVSRDVCGRSGQALIRKGVSLTDNYIRVLKRQGIKLIEVSESSDPIEQIRSVTHEELDSERNYQTQRIKVKRDAFIIRSNYVSTFHQELIFELPSLCQKVLIAPCFDQDDFHRILKQLDTIIQRPTVLDGLLKVKLVEESYLKKVIQVAILAIVMGQKMKMTKEQLDKLTIAALLYDIGNFWIDRTLLSKPSVLDEQERSEIEKHTSIGYSALKDVFGEEVAQVAYQHHERYDGSGYPRQLKKDEIDLFAKIVSICDVYISLINARSFRRKYEPLEALEYILGAGGTYFDPEIVHIFLEFIPLYSVGSMVELSNRCIGVVVDTKDKPLGRPIIEILFDENGQPSNNKVLDLTEHLTLSIKKIL